MSGALVPVVLSPTPLAAHMAKSILDEAGIPCAVSGEHTAALLPHWGAALHVAVMVPEMEYDRAVQAISAAMEEASKERGAPERCVGCQYDLRGLAAQERCPECGQSFEEPTRRLTFAPRPAPAPIPVQAMAALGGVTLAVGGLLAAIVVAVFVGIGILVLLGR